MKLSSMARLEELDDAMRNLDVKSSSLAYQLGNLPSIPSGRGGRPRRPVTPWPNGEPNPIQWAMLAGFFAGEGHIGTRHRAGGSVQVLISLMQAQPRPLKWIKYHFGGNLREGTQGPKSFSSGKKFYRLMVTSSADVERLLEGMFPYLLCKRREAYLALCIMNTPDKAKQYYYHWRIRHERNPEKYPNPEVRIS